jgi:LacI family transcriptional regulator
MAAEKSTSPVTLHDVARVAGVSLATASRSLNGSARKVADEYRERVLAAAASLNYTPNLSAQAVAKGTSATVVLLVADIADPYFSSIASGVIDAASTANLVVSMAVTERDSARELELVRTLRGQRPRVMILAGSRFSDDPSEAALRQELLAYEQSGGRVSFISKNDLPFSTVPLDNFAGAKALAVRLVELGYRNFAAVTRDRAIRTADDRLSGFLAGLAEHGLAIPEHRIARTAFTRDGGYNGAERLVDAGLAEVELIFAVNDVMAVGVMSALRDRGLEPGVDIAVAGYDDIPTVRDITPALTTVRIPLAEVGRRALNLALLPQATTTALDDALRTEVVVRASTPPRTPRA